MNRNEPIGCRTFHFTKKEGKSDVCMYCGLIVSPYLENSTVFNYSPLSKLTIEKLFEYNTAIDKERLK